MHTHALIIPLCLAAPLVAAAPTNLLTEWQPDGTTVHDPCPEFYWEVAGQEACQVVVRLGEEVVWDSGRLATPVTVAEYDGPVLEEGREYTWRVRVWDADGPGEWSAPARFSYRPRPMPMVRPHIRTFMNFGGATDFAVENLDLTFRREPNTIRPSILALNYSLLATMVIPSTKAEMLERFCVEEGLTEEGILEEMFIHFRTDTPVTLHVGAERAANPRETRLVPGWDPRNDRNGDGVVDDQEAANLVKPDATARRMSEARVPIYYWGPPRDDFVMNVGHPEYQRFVAEVYCPAQLEGYDGLYVDTMPPDVAGPGRAADVLEFPRPPEAPHQWLHAMQMMLARIKAALPDAPITANNWMARPFVIDGTQSENWMNAGLSPSAYEARLAAAVELDRRGKMQMLQYNPVHDEEMAEFGPKVPISRERDAILGLATYYLIHGDYTYYAYGGHPYARVQQLWPAAAAVDIGAPEGPYHIFAESEPADDAQGENLLPQGRFAPDAAGKPDGWEVAEPVELDADVRRVGAYSARIASDSPRINNINKAYVTLKPNTAYTLSCWIKTESVEGSPGAQVYPYEFEGAAGGGFITVTGTTDWTFHALSFVTGDDATGRINFRIYGATGTAWFDDIRLGEGGHLPWKVFARKFTKTLVLSKPTSAARWDDTTATEHALPGAFRPLAADGTLGAPVTTVTLRSGEGAILVRQDPPRSRTDDRMNDRMATDGGGPGRS